MIDDFLNGTGPNKIFFFYQPPYKLKDKDEIYELGSRAELFITNGIFKLTDYFPSNYFF
jgi:hypothetical protein